MADTESEVSRVARVIKRTLTGGPSDTNLPLEGAAAERKEQSDKQQGQALRMLQGLTKGKDPRAALLGQMKGQ